MYSHERLTTHDRRHVPKICICDTHAPPFCPPTGIGCLVFSSCIRSGFISPSNELYLILFMTFFLHLGREDLDPVVVFVSVVHLPGSKRKAVV